MHSCVLSSSSILSNQFLSKHSNHLGRLAYECTMHSYVLSSSSVLSNQFLSKHSNHLGCLAYECTMHSYVLPSTSVLSNQFLSKHSNHLGRLAYESTMHSYFLLSSSVLSNNFLSNHSHHSRLTLCVVFLYFFSCPVFLPGLFKPKSCRCVLNNLNGDNFYHRCVMCLTFNFFLINWPQYSNLE